MFLRDFIQGIDIDSGIAWHTYFIRCKLVQNGELILYLRICMVENKVA